MRAKARIAVAGLCLAGTGLFAQNKADQTAPVFEIGKFDRSSAEFAEGVSTRPIEFVIGKSDPAKDWSAIQLASPEVTERSSQVEAQTAPRKIIFSLAAVPSKSYEMHIGVLTGYSLIPTGVPSIRVTINGKRGTFFLHPQLDYSNGDFADFYNPAYSYAEVRFAFPGSYLRVGENQIAIEVRQNSSPAIPNAGITYDAVALSVASGPLETNVTAAIEPTDFYLAAPLRELVDVFVRSASSLRSGDSVKLKIGNYEYAEKFKEDADFGEERVEFAAPEFAKTTAIVTWKEGRKTKSFQAEITPKKKWTLFLVPHIHLDVGYSDYQAKIASIQSRAFDEAMAMTQQHPDYSFSTDGEWNLEQFLRTRTAPDRERVISAIKKQQIFIPAQYAQLHTGTPTAETLIRSLYPSANFSRKYGTPFNYANITDVPTYSWSYASILRSAGIGYLLAGSDNIRGPVLLHGKLNENSPYWWPGPDGKKVLMWYSRHYMQMQILFGLPPLIEAGRESLGSFLQMYERDSYPANAAILFGTEQENRDLFPQQAELAAQWNKVYAYPTLKYSGVYDAMKEIQKQLGDKIPTVCCDGGSYWEDGVGTNAYFAAMERENESRGPSAEKLATLTSVVDPRFSADKQALDDMWADMVLTDEHTWASDRSERDPLSEENTGQVSVKEQFTVNASQLADFIARNSMASLADSITAPPGSLIVFNTLNWRRRGVVTTDLMHGRRIVDPTSNQVVPIELISKGNDLDRVRFVAKDVPAMGYKVYKLEKGVNEEQPRSSASKSSGADIMESPFYRVMIDASTGAIKSIYDKELGRELIDQKSQYRFGQYLYVSGGDDPRSTIIEPRSSGEKATLDIHPAHDGKLVSILRMPEGWVARLTSVAFNTPEIDTEIRLYDEEKKIEIVEKLEKTKVFRKEAGYFAFPLAMKQPQFQYEIQTGIVDPAKDAYPGAGHEWFAVQHWVAAQQDSLSVGILPIDASLVTLGDINRGEWPTEFGARPGAIFSYVFNNYWFTNFPAGQGGQFSFRYVITSAKETNSSELTRQGWSEVTPLEKNEVLYQDKWSELPRALNGLRRSFVDVDDPNVLLDAWKPAEDGDGTIMRFLDFGGTARTVSVQVPLIDLEAVVQTNTVEKDEHQLSLSDVHKFTFEIHPHEIVTVRLKGKSHVSAEQ